MCLKKIEKWSILNTKIIDYALAKRTLKPISLAKDNWKLTACLLRSGEGTISS